MMGRETVSAGLLGHPALLLGGPRALLLQVANPGVAAGVARYSGFATDPFGRLARTLTAMDRIAFGRPDRAVRTLRGLDAVHRRVAGVTAGGIPYSAHDPDLVLWVHATLVDTVLEVESRYLGVLRPAERHRFYDESRRLARAFAVPEDMIPPDLPAFEAYMGAAIGRLEVGDDALRIARQIVRPPFGATLGTTGTVLSVLSAPVIEAVTADLLPVPLRRAYGLRRGAGLVPAALALELAAGLSRLVSPRLPGAVTAPGTMARATRRLVPHRARPAAPGTEIRKS